MKHTIIYLHKGNSWYLSLSLQQARRSNPNNRIVLLGDETNCCYGDMVEHYSISSYFEGAKTFSMCYKHLSASGYEYELLNFQRWFVWRDFMRSEHIDKAMLPDTDVLLLDDISRYFDTITDKFSYTYGTSNHMGFVYIHIDVLERFCDFLLGCYQSKDTIIELEQSYYEWCKIHPGWGGISDITLFIWFYERCKGTIRWNTEEFINNNCVFAHSLASDCFYKPLRRKYIKIKKYGDGFFVQTSKGEVCRLIGVHCSGIQKEEMMRICDLGNNFHWRKVYYWKTSLVHRLIRKVRSIKRIGGL